MKSGEWILAVWVGALVACIVMLLSGHTITPTEWIAGVKDLATAMGVVVAAYVGIRGLSTWERQLKGNADFEAARALARATYKLRDQIRYCRAPMIWAYEFPADFDSLRQPTASPEREKAWRHVYQARWDPVAERLLEFDLAGLEAESLWGADARTARDALRGCCAQLIAAIEHTVQRNGDTTPQALLDSEFEREMRQVVSDTSPKNPFSIEIDAAIDRIDELLMPHLSRRR